MKYGTYIWQNLITVLGNENKFKYLLSIVRDMFNHGLWGGLLINCGHTLAPSIQGIIHLGWCKYKAIWCNSLITSCRLINTYVTFNKAVRRLASWSVGSVDNNVSFEMIAILYSLVRQVKLYIHSDTDTDAQAHRQPCCTLRDHVCGSRTLRSSISCYFLKLSQANTPLFFLGLLSRVLFN